MTGNGSRLLFRQRKNFETAYVEAWAFTVPPSDRYPDAVKYSYQRGARESGPNTAWDDGTIFRYDNSPDHPDAPRHHKHTRDGRVVGIDFAGVRPLYDRFKQEVIDNGEGWK